MMKHNNHLISLLLSLLAETMFVVSKLFDKRRPRSKS